MAQQTIQGREGMSIYDACLMCYSGFDNIIKFLKDNGIENMNDMNMAGRTLVYDTNLSQSTSLNSVINNRGFVFATAELQEQVRTTEDGYVRITEQGYTRLL